jgi:hypothetical protein
MVGPSQRELDALTCPHIADVGGLGEGHGVTGVDADSEQVPVPRAARASLSALLGLRTKLGRVLAGAPKVTIE